MRSRVKFHILITSCVITAVVIFLTRYKYDSYSIPQKPIPVDNNIEFKSMVRTKYILVWTSYYSNTEDEGTKIFEQRKCVYTNCYLTRRRNYFYDTTKFNAIILFANYTYQVVDLPMSRSPHQKYIFASSESAANYPVCHKIFNNYFNWTWTYKFDSDEMYGYIAIKNKKGDIIGPKKVMHWKNVREMEPIDNDMKHKLGSKYLAVASFISECHTQGRREVLIRQLTTELELLDLKLDLYGQCGSNPLCMNESGMAECFQMLTYYFYLSFEDSLSADYVTEMLLYSLKSFTVPVVFGYANYTRFMPHGIYLDANLMTAAELASQIYKLINNKERYYDYFKWHNHYSYHDVRESPVTDPYCKLCSLINDEKRLNTPSVYQNFIYWWNGSNKCAN